MRAACQAAGAYREGEGRAEARACREGEGREEGGRRGMRGAGQGAGQGEEEEGVAVVVRLPQTLPQCLMMREWGHHALCPFLCLQPQCQHHRMTVRPPLPRHVSQWEERGRAREAPPLHSHPHHCPPLTL